MHHAYRLTQRTLQRAITAQDAAQVEQIFRRQAHRIPPPSLVPVMAVAREAGKVAFATAVFEYVTNEGARKAAWKGTRRPDDLDLEPAEVRGALLPSGPDLQEFYLQYFRTIEAAPSELPRLLDAVHRNRRSVPWTTDLFNSLFRTLSAAHQMPLAAEPWDRMLVRAKHDPSCAPDAETYAILLRGYAAAGLYDSCRRVRAALNQDSWVAWTPELYAAVLESGLPHEGMAFAQRYHADLLARGLRPTADVLAALLQYVHHHRRFEDAPALYRDYVENKIEGDAPLLDRLVRALAAAGAHQEVAALATEISRRNIAVSPDLLPVLLRSRAPPPTPAAPTPPRPSPPRGPSPTPSPRTPRPLRTAAAAAAH